MALSNTAVPRYYGMFRDAVIRGEIPVCKEISMEMNRIDDLIVNPGVYYDDQAVEGWILYCEEELTLTDGSDLNLLDSFKVWGEQVFGWYYFVERSVYEPNSDGRGGLYVKKTVKKRLINKQYLIVGRGAAKSVYDSCMQSFFENVDTTTTHQITTAPTMKQASMTATVIAKQNESKNREVITAEVIYYWMIALNVPFECQKWHLNRLLMLINVCNIKNSPPKKMGRQALMSRNSALNAARRRKHNSRG